MLPTYAEVTEILVLSPVNDHGKWSHKIGFKKKTTTYLGKVTITVIRLNMYWLITMYQALF